MRQRWQSGRRARAQCFERCSHCDKFSTQLLEPNKWNYKPTKIWAHRCVCGNCRTAAKCVCGVCTQSVSVFSVHDIFFVSLYQCQINWTTDRLRAILPKFLLFLFATNILVYLFRGLVSCKSRCCLSLPQLINRLQSRHSRKHWRYAIFYGFLIWDLIGEENAYKIETSYLLLQVGSDLIISCL